MVLMLSSILALLAGAAGWFYLFYSKAASNLAALEEQRLNARRVRLRRIGGVVMLLLAVAFFALFNSVDPQRTPRPFLLLLASVFTLLAILIALALVDIRLTWKLRHQRKDLPIDKHP